MKDGDIPDDGKSLTIFSVSLMFDSCCFVRLKIFKFIVNAAAYRLFIGFWLPC